MKGLFRLFVPACTGVEPASGAWLAALRGYLATTGVLNLAWETAQLPLYTFWNEAKAGSKAFAVLHCTAGDLLIALSLLPGALIVAGDPVWPRRRFGGVAAMTFLGGLIYTVCTEWLNVEVRRSWAYSDLMPVLPLFLMPVLPLFGTGLSPMLQWIIVPAAALWIARRASSARPR